MGIRKYRGQILVVKDWPDGRRFKRQCANKTEAKNLLGDVEASIRNGTWTEFRDQLKLRNRDEERVTLRQYCVTYLEQYARVRNKPKAWKRKKTSFNALNPVLGHLDLKEILPAHLHNYVRKRKVDGLSDATINRDLTIIKHMFNYAAECGIIESNPVEKFKLLREERKERPRFTEEQIWSVINAVRADCRPMFAFIRETGCRREEALSLKHSQIQEESQLAVFGENTKSRRYRYVPLTDAAIGSVKALPRLEGSPYVFYNLKTRDRWKECRKEWEKAREKAGFPEMQVKDLRRHYAICLAEQGADMHDIQQVLGHSSVVTTERHYAQFSPQHSARKILKVLEGGRSKGTNSELSDFESQREASTEQ